MPTLRPVSVDHTVFQTYLIELMSLPKGSLTKAAATLKRAGLLGSDFDRSQYNPRNFFDLTPQNIIDNQVIRELSSNTRRRYQRLGLIRKAEDEDGEVIFVPTLLARLLIGKLRGGASARARRQQEEAFQAEFYQLYQDIQAHTPNLERGHYVRDLQELFLQQPAPEPEPQSGRFARVKRAVLKLFTGGEHG